MRPLLLGMALSIAATACSKPAVPTFVPVRARINNLTSEGIDLNVSLQATNPNDIDLPLRQLTGHVVLSRTIDLGTVTIPVTTQLPAHQTVPLDVPLSVKWTDLVALGQAALSGQNQPYTVDGSVGLGGDLISVDVPYHLDGSVTSDQLQRVVKNSIPGLPLIPGLLGGGHPKKTK